MNYKKIFFSYSRNDTAFAVKLATDLKKEGYDIWIDQEDIRAGSEWDMEIEKALSTCDCVVFIQSEKSAASPNVLDEVYYALEENKTVIPVIIKESKAPFRIKRLQHIDFTNSYEAGLKSLKDNLSGAVLPGVEHTNNSTLTFNKKYFFGLLLLVIVITGIFYFVEKTPDDKQTTGHFVAAIEDFNGRWALDHVEPAMKESKGYLTIDSSDGKLDIKTSVQFYYTKTNDTAYLSVFNAFAECKNCFFNNEIVLSDKQVDVGAQKYVMLKTDEPGKGKAGDTIMNAGINTAIKASVVLHIDKNNVHVTITAKDSTVGSHGIVIPSFNYNFFFSKDN